MRALKRTALEAIALAMVGLVVALTANGVRAKGSIKFGRDYFDAGLEKANRAREAALTAQHKSEGVIPERAEAMERAGSNDAAGDVAAVSDDHPEHGYQVASLNEVVAMFDDPNTEMGLYVFVDARNDEAYEEGHIPGAIQADHYRIEDFIDNILLHAEAAEKLIVYCNGGNCEDSILVCSDLLDAGVSYDMIYLFTDGWKAWTAANMPVATGPEGEAGAE